MGKPICNWREMAHVVSCGECKHLFPSPNGEGKWCDFHGRHVKEDDFCSWGKKRMVKIVYDGCTTAVDGSNSDLILGVERILEEIAYKRETDVWDVLKEVTVAVVNRESYE